MATNYKQIAEHNTFASTSLVFSGPWDAYDVSAWHCQLSSFAGILPDGHGSSPCQVAGAGYATVPARELRFILFACMHDPKAFTLVSVYLCNFTGKATQILPRTDRWREMTLREQQTGRHAQTEAKATTNTNAESTSLVTCTPRCIRCVRVVPRANARSSVFARLSWHLWLWTKRREPVLQAWCISKIGSCPCLGVDMAHDICSTLWSPVPWCFPFPNPSAEVLWMAIVWQALPMALLHCTQQAVAASSSTSYIWTADRGG
jgi:hypothetical protein